MHLRCIIKSTCISGIDLLYHNYNLNSRGALGTRIDYRTIDELLHGLQLQVIMCIFFSMTGPAHFLFFRPIYIYIYKWGTNHYGLLHRYDNNIHFGFSFVRSSEPFISPLFPTQRKQTAPCIWCNDTIINLTIEYVSYQAETRWETWEWRETITRLGHGVQCKRKIFWRKYQHHDFLEYLVIF